MPGWQRVFEPHVKKGALTVIGVVQEQHADRARLYKQWRGFDWPIFVDTLNVLAHRVVPIPIGININGVIIYPRLRGEGDLKVLLQKDFIKQARNKTLPKNTHKADRNFYARAFDNAVAGYQGKDAATLFKLGCALRARFESDARKPGDGQAAVEAWGKALALKPNQYIWRRRIQQYGPRLAKPYNFYSWVEQARKEIRARGEEPVELRVEPRGAELIERRGAPSGDKPVDSDPLGKIQRDRSLVQIATIVTPASVRPGHAVRVRLIFRPRLGLWNNEGGALTLAVDPGGLSLTEGTFRHPIAKRAESSETRYLEFEVVTAAGDDGKHEVQGYALYYVCKKKGGVCLYLRQDFQVTIKVDPNAPAIQR